MTSFANAGIRFAADVSSAHRAIIQATVNDLKGLVSRGEMPDSFAYDDDQIAKPIFEITTDLIYYNSVTESSTPRRAIFWFFRNQHLRKIFLWTACLSFAATAALAEVRGGPFRVGDKIFVPDVSGIALVAVRDCVTLTDCEIMVATSGQPAVEYYRGYLLDAEDLRKRYVSYPPVSDEGLAEACSNKLLKTRLEYRIRFRGMDGTMDRLVMFSESLTPKAPHCASAQGSLGNGEVSIFEFKSETSGLMIEDNVLGLN